MRFAEKRKKRVLLADQSRPDTASARISSIVYITETSIAIRSADPSDGFAYRIYDTYARFDHVIPVCLALSDL